MNWNIILFLYNIDFGGQNATGSNNHTSAINTNTEADTQTEHQDETSDMYTNRMSEDTTRLHFGRSPNDTRMQTSRYCLYNSFFIITILQWYNLMVSCSYIGNNYFLIFKGIEHHHPDDKQKEVQVIIIIRFLVALYQEIPLTDQLRTHYCLQT